MLFIYDNKGIPIIGSELIAGNHQDIFELEGHMDKMLEHEVV